MPTYKLTYFDIRGLAEAARLIFAHAGQKYEDIRLPMGETSFKSKAPFGQVPLLEVDGQTIAQSFAIYRYLARQFGLAGQNAIEEAQVDSVADAAKDFANEIQEWFAIAVGFKQGDKDALYKEKVEPAKEKYLAALEKFLDKSHSGFLVGNKETWADLLITDRLASMENMHPGALDGHPKIKQWVEKVRAIPNIKKWIETRPQTKF